jgi:hypothetical protein
MRCRQVVSLVAAVLCAVALSSCGSSDEETATPMSTTPPGAPEFAPRPDNTMELAGEAGIVVDSSEHLDFHEHATLLMTVDGEPVAVPANIGVGPTSIAELHTHDTSGTLHLEAAGEITDGSFDLGHFFDTWGVTLDENCVGEHCKPDATIAFTVEGEPYTANPRTIALRDGVEIQLAIS